MDIEAIGSAIFRYFELKRQMEHAAEQYRNTGRIEDKRSMEIYSKWMDTLLEETPGLMPVLEDIYMRGIVPM